jgi:GNAT superfamily N-acetyltransferase
VAKRVTIGEMTPADVGAVTGLMRQVYADDPRVIDPEHVRLEWKRFIAYDRDGAPVGYLFGTLLDYGLPSEAHGTVVELIVDESVRRQGVGRGLVDAWRALHDAGIPFGFLLAADAAVPLYEACGFLSTGLPYMMCDVEPSSNRRTASS